MPSSTAAGVPWWRPGTYKVGTVWDLRRFNLSYVMENRHPGGELHFSLLKVNKVRTGLGAPQRTLD